MNFECVILGINDFFFFLISVMFDFCLCILLLGWSWRCYKRNWSWTCCHTEQKYQSKNNNWSWKCWFVSNVKYCYVYHYFTFLFLFYTFFLLLLVRWIFLQLSSFYLTIFSCDFQKSRCCLCLAKIVAVFHFLWFLCWNSIFSLNHKLHNILVLLLRYRFLKLLLGRYLAALMLS